MSSIRAEYKDQSSLAQESKTLNKLIEERFKLSKASFQSSSAPKSMSIADQTSWLFEHLLQHPYQQPSYVQAVGRKDHGVQHAARVAIWIILLVNWNRRYGDEAAEKLTTDEIVLLIMAGLFHDSARKNDGVDEWDRDSALFFYFYAHFVLKIPAETAKRFAEAIANKDACDNKWFELDITNSLEPTWKKASPAPQSKNILQEILHDADCLDIIRATYPFKATFLDIYKKHIMGQTGELLTERLNEMAQVWMQVRKVIKIQGDAYGLQQNSVKLKYNAHDAFAKCLESISPDDHPILFKYCHQLLSVDELRKPMVKAYQFTPEDGLSEENVSALIERQTLIFRGIPFPSGKRIKIKKQIFNREHKAEHKSGHVEDTNTATEIRKAGRKPGVSSGSSKRDHLDKHGNPNRSGTVLGYSAHLFSSVGLVAFNAQQHITYVSAYDFGSGKGKKKNAVKHNDPATVEDRLFKLKLQQKLGGDKADGKTQLDINEVLFHVFASDYQAIMFTRGSTYIHYDTRNLHPLSSELLALYVQFEFQSQQGRKLPIFEYSEDSNAVKLCQFTEEDIVERWVQICSDYIKAQLLQPTSTVPYEASLDQIKINSVYGDNPDYYSYSEELTSPDSNYPTELRAKINARLDAERRKLITAHEDQMQERISSKQIDPQSDEAYFNFIRSDRLAESCRSTIESNIHQALQTEIFPNLHSVEDYCKSYYIDQSPAENFSVKATGLFKLAKKLNLNAEAEKIKYEAAKKLKLESRAIQSSIRDITPNSFLYRNPMQTVVGSVYNFATAFNLHGECKDEITAIVETSIDHMASAPRLVDSFLIKYLDERHLLDAENIRSKLQKTMVMVEKVCGEYREGSQANNIGNYLLLAKTLNVPRATVKSSFVRFLSEEAYEARDYCCVDSGGVIKGLFLHGLLEDREVFTLVCSKLKLTHIHKGLDIANLQGFFGALNALVPNYRLSQDQWSVISETVCGMMINVYNNSHDYMHRENFNFLMKLIINYHSEILSKFPAVPLPERALLYLKNLYIHLPSAQKEYQSPWLKELQDLYEIDLETYTPKPVDPKADSLKEEEKYRLAHKKMKFLGMFSKEKDAKNQTTVSAVRLCEPAKNKNWFCFKK